ncbi:MAG: Tad domain-containing protein [Pelosinus sp.]|nr:Tad domain-containing protein [Pelosinus sp.]
MQILREQKGGITVLVALTFTIVMGLGAVAVDIGNLYLHKTRLQNMADAAALAGVQELPDNGDKAAQIARNYAMLNGKSGDMITDLTILQNVQIGISVKRSVPYFFAKIFGLSSQDVSASSAARIVTVSAASGIVPFGVVKQNFVYGERYILKYGGGSGYDGNFAALALGGSGSPVYQNNIKYGYSGSIKIGDWISTEPGNMSGPTGEGVSYRVSEDYTATFETVHKDSARIVIVPILDTLEVNGRSDVQVVGFAGFFLEGVGSSGNDNFVYGRFMKLVIPPADYQTSGFSELADTLTSTYGVYGARLVSSE